MVPFLDKFNFLGYRNQVNNVLWFSQFTKVTTLYCPIGSHFSYPFLVDNHPEAIPLIKNEYPELFI